MISKHIFMVIDDESVSVANSKIASNFFSRFIGLLSTKKLAADAGLFITKCNSIHTFFMRYVIDVVFVNKHLVVTKVVRNVRPWRVAFDRNATAVLELPAGCIDIIGINVGRQLFMRDIK